MLPPTILGVVKGGRKKATAVAIAFLFFCLDFLQKLFAKLAVTLLGLGEVLQSVGKQTR